MLGLMGRRSLPLFLPLLLRLDVSRRYNSLLEIGVSVPVIGFSLLLVGGSVYREGIPGDAQVAR
jgi:hypothetical protein